MKRGKRFCPDWSWWIRSGERLNLGLGLEAVLSTKTGVRRPADRRGLEAVSVELRSGKRLVEAMRSCGLHLPVEGWCLLEAGERSGRLGDALRGVGDFLRVRREHRRECIGQFWYPAMVGVTGSGVMCLILFWVLPQMRRMTAAMGLGRRLPWLTENIGTLYAAVFGGLAFLVLLVAGTAACLGLSGRRSVRASRLAEVLFSHAPLIGSSRALAREARILKQLGTLLRGGTTLPRSLEMVAANSPGAWEAQQVLQLRSFLVLGTAFAEALRACPLFQPETVDLLEAGQESGRLEDYMERIAGELETALQWRVRQMTRILEPGFLFLLSGAVGGLILAYLLPMIRMLEQAGVAF